MDANELEWGRVGSETLLVAAVMAGLQYVREGTVVVPVVLGGTAIAFVLFLVWEWLRARRRNRERSRSP